jgi:hypothetical protein
VVEFVEQVVLLAHPVYENSTLHLHADGRYELDPPFDTREMPFGLPDILWPRRMGINVQVERELGSTLPPFEPMSVSLFEDGTYELESPLPT